MPSWRKSKIIETDEERATETNMQEISQHNDQDADTKVQVDVGVKSNHNPLRVRNYYSTSVQ